MALELFFTRSVWLLRSRRESRRRIIPQPPRVLPARGDIRSWTGHLLVGSFGRYTISRRLSLPQRNVRIARNGSARPGLCALCVVLWQFGCGWSRWAFPWFNRLFRCGGAARGLVEDIPRPPGQSGFSAMPRDHGLAQRGQQKIHVEKVAHEISSRRTFTRSGVMGGAPEGATSTGRPNFLGLVSPRQAAD
jgi:hypothetical protein